MQVVAAVKTTQIDPDVKYEGSVKLTVEERRNRRMCMSFSPHEGIPINGECLANMTSEERIFWESFLEQAEQVIRNKRSAGESEPFVPPQHLKDKYQEAIAKYNGEAYCQVHQLQAIFSF